MEVTRGFGVFVASGALALACAATSKAQCAGMTGFMNIGTVEQNPFEAELKVTHDTPLGNEYTRLLGCTTVSQSPA